MVLQPGKEEFAEAIFRKWDLDFAVIGRVTDTGRMVLEHHGEIVCDIPLAPLADDAPLYDRPSASETEYKAWTAVKPLGEIVESTDLGADLVCLLASADIASRRWIWEQYDSQVGGNTVQKSGGDAALVRIHGSQKAIAISTDCNPRYCYADPVEGGKQAIAEAYRNISAVGATPLAVTNCLNFGNPQRPEIMAQITGCLAGMGEACRALQFPIVSGNVSLYNESKATGGGSAILPTPAIGGVGLILNWERAVGIAGFRAGDRVWLVGGNGRHLGQSSWLRFIHGREDGKAPHVNLDAEKANGEYVRHLIETGQAKAVHDISDGGMAVALSEMALASGVGFELNFTPTTAEAFGEDQARYLVVTNADAEIENAIALGTAKGADIFGVPINQLRNAFEGFLPKIMEH